VRLVWGVGAGRQAEILEFREVGCEGGEGFLAGRGELGSVGEFFPAYTSSCQSETIERWKIC